MTISFRPALRENVGLWVNIIGGTGSGKSFSGMRLASGIAGDKPFAVIDTENRRALHYADRFRFDHAELRAPFRPDAYAEAVVAADAAGYPVIMIDSGSHVWAGDGGVLDWQEEELDRMAGDDWKKREACKMAAWIQPKLAHKRMVSKLLQVKAHIILCLRAEPKIEMVRGDNGKMEIRAKESLTGLNGWIPVCEKNLPFEATASFLLMADAPGIPHPIKLQEQHRDIFPAGKLIDEEAGRRLAQWAAGGTPVQPAGIEERVRACTTRDALKALWIEVNPADTVRYKPMFAKRGKEIDGASQPVQQPQGGEAREEADKGKENGSQTGAPEEKVSGVPTIADALDAIERGNYDLAADISRSLPEGERLDIEHKLSMRQTT